MGEADMFASPTDELVVPVDLSVPVAWMPVFAVVAEAVIPVSLSDKVAFFADAMQVF
jgi:hypothetical protein